MLKCAICGKDCKNYNSLAQHIKAHNITSKEYYDAYICPNTVHTCKYCGKPVNTFININKGYATVCGIDCTRHNAFKHIDINKRNEKSAKTKLEKYGTSTYNNRAKCIETVNNYTDDQKNKIKERRKKTCQDRYGVDTPMESPSIRKKWADNYFEKTGYRHQSQNPVVKNKIKNTILERYGVDNASKNDDIKKKIKDTKLRLYGNQNNIEKPRITNIKKYGFPCSWSNPEVRAKCCVKYSYDSMNFDSKLELAFYIYNKDLGKNIVRNPNVSFEFTAGNKTHQCFPDFKLDDKLYEIKGDQFVDKNTGKWIDPFSTKNDEFYEAKHQCLIKNSVIILYQCDMKPYLNYIKTHYGKYYLNTFRKCNNKEIKK